LPVDILPTLFQYRAMLGETHKQFSLTRAALSSFGRAQKQILISPACEARNRVAADQITN